MTDQTKKKLRAALLAKAEGKAFKLDDVEGCCFCPIELGTPLECNKMLSGLKRIYYTCTPNLTALTVDTTCCDAITEFLSFDLLSQTTPGGALQRITYNEAKDKTFIETNEGYDPQTDEETDEVILTIEFENALDITMLAALKCLRRQKVSFVIQDRSNNWWIIPDAMYLSTNNWTSQTAGIRQVVFLGKSNINMYPLGWTDADDPAGFVQAQLPLLLSTI